MFLGLLVLVSVVPGGKAVEVPLKYCSQGNDLIKMNKVEANMWPPAQGHNLDIDMRGEVTEDIKGGAFDMMFTYNSRFDESIKLEYQSSVLTLTGDDTIKKGPFHFHREFPVLIMPPGLLFLKVQMKDQLGRSVLCAELTLNSHQ